MKKYFILNKPKLDLQHRKNLNSYSSLNFFVIKGKNLINEIIVKVRKFYF